MKTIKIILITLLLAVIITATGQPAFAGRSVGELEKLIDVNPQAPGTKWSGPLTVYYEIVDFNPLNCPIYTVNTLFFMRLKQGEIRQIGFSGIVPNTCLTDTDAQKIGIDEFFKYEVLPVISSGGKNYKVKALKDLVEEDQSLSGKGPLFSIANITIAIQ